MPKREFPLESCSRTLPVAALPLPSPPFRELHGGGWIDSQYFDALQSGLIKQVRA